MDRIWILTINDDDNYGNRLQNYALQTMLHRYGPEVATLYAPKIHDTALAAAKGRLRPYRHALARAAHGSQGLWMARHRRFMAFTDEWIGARGVRVPSRAFAGAIGAGDRFVIGSDQVWNDRMISRRMLDVRLGSLFPGQSTISYAASFGIDAVRGESERLFAERLPRLAAVSVREDRGAELVRELAGREAEVVLDPTLMLGADAWRGMIPDGSGTRDGRPYVLTYFLGRPSAVQDDVIRRYAARHGCEVRRMLDPADPDTYTAGPREFVGLFAGARHVFTDSYHACCFSLLFGRQFKVFDRAGYAGGANMNSRMRTLFRLCGLDLMMGCDTRLDAIDYGRVDPLLERHRARSWAWLDAAMAKAGGAA